MSISELKPSKLGTKEHWDNVYEEELANFEEIGDEGEIWFGVESIEKMVEWTLKNLPPIQKPSILEIGSGNGTLLFGLFDANYHAANLSGIDYSADAVKLSKSVATVRGAEAITFTQSNFLEDDPLQLPHMQNVDSWDLLLDKGTYDAIALGEKDENGLSPAAKYPARVTRLLKPGGYFLITSCNFTEDELKAAFANETTGLEFHSRIQYPTFTFGGKSGSICSGVAFRKPTSKP